MQKDDWYFLIPLILALLAFFGVDWKRIRKFIRERDKTMHDGFPFRQVLFIVLIVASLSLSSFGWYESTTRPMHVLSVGGMRVAQESFVPQNSVWNSGLRV